MINTNSRTKSVAIIGAGQMGSRLIQGLLTVSNQGLDQAFDVHIVDPSATSRQTAYDRAIEVLEREGTVARNRISLHSEISGLPAELDLLLFAATSRHRFQNLMDGLEETRPKTILLEKFLFDRPEQYERAGELLARRNIPAFVHCPRSYWPVYANMRKAWRSKRAFVRVTGCNFALASNGVHFLDLCRFMNGLPVSVVRPNLETLRSTDNKRAGYREVLGVIEAADAMGSVAEMTCEDGDCLQLAVEIEVDDEVMRVDETGGRWERRSGDGTILDTGEFTPLFASNNAAVFEDLLSGQTPALPTLEQSSITHLAFIDALMPVIGSEDGSFPVT